MSAIVRMALGQKLDLVAASNSRVAEDPAPDLGGDALTAVGGGNNDRFDEGRRRAPTSRLPLTLSLRSTDR
jgi:hypothetical protein